MVGGSLAARLGILAFCLCLLSACGGSSSTTGNLRFVQASPDAPSVTVYLNRKLMAANMNYPNSTGYVSIRSGTRLEVFPASGSTVIFQMKVPIAGSANETLIMTGAAAQPTSTLLTDGGSTAVAGNGNIRVVNASRGMGTPDVYIVPAGTNLSGAIPSVANLGFNSDSGYIATPTGTYEVVMTVPGTKNALLTTGPINLSGSSNQTVIGLDNTAGGFTSTVLTDQ